jgi:ribonuclease P protein component
MLEVRVLASPLLHPRVGVIVPKYRHGSVERNRLKRRLRELVRLRLLPALVTGPPVDAVVRVVPQAYGATFDTLAAEMERILRQLARSRPASPPAAAPAAPAPPGAAPGVAGDGSGPPAGGA